MIQRTLQQTIQKTLGENKAIILLGARQTGKSTLINAMFKEVKDDVLFLNGDEIDVQALFENITSTKLQQIIGNKKYLIIDEAQRIKDIGLRLKLVTDNLKDVHLIATGSSSFELANKVNEPLTGRKKEFKLFPLSFKELTEHTDLLTQKRLLPQLLVYGSYPEVITNKDNKREVLSELTSSYVYQDILSFDRIRSSEKLVKLLRALALQIGSQVSYTELGQLCGLDCTTVSHYIDILEKAYIIFRLGTYSSNLRNELKFSRKIYFWDNGIRNAILGNYAALENRTDVGELWENYLISERLKKNSYEKSYANSYFWRTKEQKEIDYIEEKDGILTAWEFKWSETKALKAKCPLSFRNAYPETSFNVITQSNIEDFLL